MAHAPEEVAEMVGIASVLVINIGTLSREWIEALGLARQAAALALALDYGCLVVVSGAIDLITEGRKKH